MENQVSHGTDDQPQKVSSSKPDTTRISTDSPYVVIAEPLIVSVRGICERLGVQFKKVTSPDLEAAEKEINQVRIMLFELLRTKKAPVF